MMNTKIKLIVLLVTLLISGCHQDQKLKNKETLKELLKFEQIKESDLHIRNLTQNTSGISLMDEGMGKDGNSYFKVGYNGDERFETYYTIRWNVELNKYQMEDLSDGTWKDL